MQQQFCDEVLIRTANEGWFRPSIVIAVFVESWDVAVGQPHFWALINTIQACRQQRARVEGPDHVQQFAQLSAVLAPWYNSSRATDATDVGTYADEFQLSGVFLNCELTAARLAFAAVGVTADTAGLQIKQHWLARNCPKGDAKSIVKTLLDWGWSAIPLQRVVNKAGDRGQWRLGSEVPPPASRMYLKDQTVVFEPLEFPSKREAKPQLLGASNAASVAAPPPPGLPAPPKQTAQPIAPLLQSIPAQASADLKQYVDQALEAQAQKHGAEMTALRQEVSQANRQGMEVSQKVDVLAASVQSVAGVAQEAHATATSLATMIKELQAEQKASFERLEGMLPERPRKCPGQDNPDEQL